MRERRQNPDWDPAVRTWTKIWLALLIFAAMLWITDASANEYGYGNEYGGYRSGWRSDMYDQERRQTELMEMQEDRARREERRRSYERNRGNVERYHDNLRRGAWY